jgi:hypothetical protein
VSCLLFAVAVAAGGIIISESIRHATTDGQGPRLPPFSTDTGGQPADPGGLEPQDSHQPPEPAGREARAIYETARRVNYRGTYFAHHPRLRPFSEHIVVHHRIPLDVLLRRPGLFTAEELNAATKLRGIPVREHSHLHLSVIHRNLWDKFWTNNPHATREHIIAFARSIDEQYDLQNLAYKAFLQP